MTRLWTAALLVLGVAVLVAVVVWGHVGNSPAPKEGARVMWEPPETGATEIERLLLHGERDSQGLPVENKQLLALTETVDLVTTPDSESDADEKDDSVPEPLVFAGLEKYVQYVLHVESEGSSAERESMVQKLARYQFPRSVERVMLKADERIDRTTGFLKQALFQIVALTRLMLSPSDDNVLVVKNNFEPLVDGRTLLSRLRQIPVVRWDVICLTQYPGKRQRFGPVWRLADHRDTCAMIIHRRYVKRMFKHLERRVRPIFQSRNNTSLPEYDLGAILAELQEHDIWLGFDLPCARNRDASPRRGSIVKMPAFVLQNVCVVQIGSDEPDIRDDMFDHFLKGHHLHFVVFRDGPPQDTHTELGSPLYYRQPLPHLPLEPLYVYHYLDAWLSSDTASRYDFVFYVAPNMRMNENPLRTTPPDLVGVAHPSNLLPDEDKKLSWASTGQSALPEDKRSPTYFSRKFQGGKVSAMHQACQTIRAWVDQDVHTDQVPQTQDEAYWNKYLSLHPPRTVLSQSYVYDHTCTQPSHQASTICQALQFGGHRPLMVDASSSSPSPAE